MLISSLKTLRKVDPDLLPYFFGEFRYYSISFEIAREFDTRRYDWEQMNAREVGFKNYLETGRDRSKCFKFSDRNAALHRNLQKEIDDVSEDSIILIESACNLFIQILYKVNEIIF